MAHAAKKDELTAYEDTSKSTASTSTAATAKATKSEDDRKKELLGEMTDLGLKSLLALKHQEILGSCTVEEVEEELKRRGLLK